MNIQTTWCLAPIALAAVLGVGTAESSRAAPAPDPNALANPPRLERADADPANAGFFEVFIRIDGLQGPVTFPGYEGWFDAQALQSNVAAPPRNQPGRSLVAPQRFIGNLAQALPPLLSSFAGNRVYAEVELTFVLPVLPNPIPVLTIKLDDVSVTEILQREAGDGFSNSYASLEYERIEWLTSHFHPSRGWQINANRAGWDLVNQRRF